MNKVMHYTLITLMFGLFVTIALDNASAGPRIAVVDFENKAGGWGGWRLGNQAADMLTTKLVKSKAFSVYEREKLGDVMREQNLGESGRVTQATAAKIGKLIGVEFVVFGAVTEFGKSESGAHGHTFGVNRDTYAGTVDVRVVNATSGEIVFAETASSESSNVQVSVLGFGGGKGYDEKIAHEVLRQAIDNLSEQLVAQVGSLQGSAAASKESQAVNAKIAKVNGKEIWINAGSNAGIKVGDSFVVYQRGEEVVDPDTGTSLGAEEKRIGSLKITKVEEKYAIGTADTTQTPKVGDIVK